MFKRSNTSNSENIEDKTERLLKIVKESPYHQLKESSSLIIGKGYKWVLISAYLKSLKEESGFESIMDSSYFTEDEKSFILFNINIVKEISEWSCADFLKEVKKFKNNGEEDV